MATSRARAAGDRITSKTSTAVTAATTMIMIFRMLFPTRRSYRSSPARDPCRNDSISSLRLVEWHRTRLVAHRRHLPGLPALVRRLQRRRHRRPPGNHERDWVRSRELGVDAVWLSPFMTSPQKDAGYDVADYCDVDPLFGTLADFDAMLAAAHALGLRVIVDLVPNHSFERAPLVPGGARGAARVAGARPLPVPRGPRRARRAPAEQLGVGLRRTRLDAHHRGRRQPRASGTCTSSTRRSPTSTGPTRGCTSSSAACCGSGSTAASTDSASMSRTAWSRPTGCPTTRPPPTAAAWAAAHELTTIPYWAQPGVHEIYRDWHRVLAEYGPRPRAVRRGVGRAR